jgi:membrane-associated phospholipid phosphatase
MRRWLIIFISLVALSASAKPRGAPPKVLPFAAHGAFVGDEYRFDRNHVFTGFLMRFGADFVSIPTGMPWWSPGDWAIMTGVLASTIALSVVTSVDTRPASVDTVFQNFLTYEMLGGADHFKVWGPIGDPAIWTSVGVALIATLLYGFIAHNDDAIEYVSLMFEAAIVAQLYHQVIKLVTGRAGPQRPEMYGQYYGPGDVASNGGTWLWPQGTPSGHMATMYAMLSVVMYMVDHPAVWVGLHAVALIFGASLIGDNYHWLSDVTFGAALGYAVGRWVVLHRSTHYVYGVDAHSGPRLELLPLLVPSSGIGGLAIVGTF